MRKGWKLQVGVISDTHGRLTGSAFVELADCDHIIHAGDICGPGILDELRTLAPVTAVLGNNDYSEYGLAVGCFACPTIEGVRFLVTHTPRDLALALHGGLGVLSPGDPLPQVAIHGHTHVPKLASGRDASPAGWLLCPGSASYPRGGSHAQVAKVEIEAGAVRGIRFFDV